MVEGVDIFHRDCWLLQTLTDDDCFFCYSAEVDYVFYMPRVRITQGEIPLTSASSREEGSNQKSNLWLVLEIIIYKLRVKVIFFRAFGSPKRQSLVWV